jgi:hypothetical protein
MHSTRRIETALTLFCMCSYAGLLRADTADVVVTRSHLRAQLYLYNGWMADMGNRLQRAQGRESFAFTHSSLLTSQHSTTFLPVERVMTTLLGQLDQRRLSSKEQAEYARRLRKWVDLIAVTRSITSGQAQPLSTQLPSSAVGLHFLLVPQGQSLVTSLRSQARAYGKIQELLRSLTNDYAALASPFENNPEQRDSAPATLRWIASVRENLPSLRNLVSSVGYPAPQAIELDTSLGQLYHALDVLDGKAAASTLRPASTSAVATMAHWMSELVSQANDAGTYCATMADAYSDIPAGLDMTTIRLAWSSMTPLALSSPQQVAVAMDSVNTWLAEQQLADNIRLNAVSFGLTNVTCVFQTKAGFPAVQASPDSLIQKLFSKCVASLAASPMGLGLNVFSTQWHAQFALQDGHLSGTATAYASATVTNDVSWQTLETRFGQATNRPKEEKWPMRQLSKAVRVQLVKFLAGFVSTDGSVSVVCDQGSLLIVRVTNAYNMILRNQKRWEDVDINVITVPHASGAQLVCVVDGRYQAGVLAPTSLDGFRDMEPQYSKELADFAGALLDKLKETVLRDGSGKANGP